MPSISVVITTLDDQLTVRDCLDGVLRGSVSVDEILVVDRGSTDGTAAIVRRAGAPVRLIERPGSRRSEAVAAGLAEARGDVLAVVPSRAVIVDGAIDACGAAAASGGHPAAIELRPVGTTAFGSATAAIVGRDVPRVDARRRGEGRARRAVDLGGERRSSYLVADTPTRLAVEAFQPRRGRHAATSAALLGTAVVGVVAGKGWIRVAIPVGHAAATAVRSLRAGRDAGVAPHRAFLAAEIWDWGTGAGAWVAIARRFRGQA